MVAMTRRGQRWRDAASENPVLYALIVVGMIGVLALLHQHFVAMPLTGEAAEDYNALSILSKSLVNPVTPIVDSSMNAREIKSWRASVMNQCQTATTAEQVQALGRAAVEHFFVVPFNPTPQPRDVASTLKRCKRIVLDFGANIGDTCGKVIDSGLPGCNREADLKVKPLEPAFNVETKSFVDVPKRNPLVLQFSKLMQVFGSGVDGEIGPEDYCYYGVEGNPVFTKRLQALEDFVMDIRPRPVSHVHFLTESVGAGEDGMTKLYLDTINTKQNFWGSSIFKNHQDVRKSSEEAGKSADVLAADVMGYTIGTLMRKTLVAFDPNASEEDKKGGHMILKVDIEGGEYPLLTQAAEDGTLCEFVKLGNAADLYIEYHSQKVTGSHDYKRSSFEKTLSDCGVNFRNLAAWWH